MVCQVRAGTRKPVRSTTVQARRRVAPRRGFHPDQWPPALPVAGGRHGNVLDVLAQAHRNALAAKKLFRKLLRGLQYAPRVLVTDKLASDSVAHREMLASVEHRRYKYLNNRAENSHQPNRQGERAMKRFTSPGYA